MLKSLIWKEFREVLPICATAIAAQLLLIGYSVNAWRMHLRSDAYGAWPLLYLIVVLLGIAIGVWQNVRDDNQGTFQFLLHRPITRSLIFILRLSVGAAVCLVFGLLPIVLFTIWIEGIFPNRGMGTWEPLRGLCTGIWAIYVGAFLSVLRPARWYGSRFLPLLAGILLFIFIQIAFSAAAQMQGSLWLFSWLIHIFAILLGPLLAFGFAIAALYVAEMRDYA